MEAINYMDIKEFREQGFLQEANRLFFHPLGLALEVVINEDGTETLGGIWDYRDDPEGIIFGEVTPGMRHKRALAAEEYKRHAGPRILLLASAVQSLDVGLDSVNGEDTGGV